MKAYKKIILISFILLLCLQNKLSAQDTLSVTEPSKPVFEANPRRATMLAVTFPGFGQIYNRKYWKIPLVYAGFGGIAYAISYNGSLYNKYMKAYQDFTDDIPETDSYLNILSFADPEDYDPVLHPDTYDESAAAWYRERMLKQIDYNKKYRDLSYIGIALWYLITVLDANVDASLYNYDISDNLEFALAPVQMPLSGRSMGLNISMIVTF